jgi:hypothetical protein
MSNVKHNVETSPFSRPILIYSDYCEFSSKFISILVKNPNLMEQFVRVNIDVNPDTKKRNPVFYQIQDMLQMNILEVPTIIVENGKYVLSGDQAFMWLEEQINKQISQKEISAFVPNEMNSFSDQYSSYGSKSLNDARDQSFKFLNRPDQPIRTPQESSEKFSENDYNRKQKERESLGSVKSGGISSGYAKMSQPVEFTLTESPQHNKKEVERKYEQLMSERNM